MSKDINILLQHILESIEALENYLADVEKEEYLSNMEKQDSAERRLQIIGEAVVQLPEEFKNTHPTIEWNKIAGLRNRLVHEYFDVDHLIIWNTLNQSLPIFKKQVQELIK